MDFWANAQIGLDNWAVFYQNGGQMNVGGYLSIARYGGSGYLEVNGGMVNSYNRQMIVGEVGYGSMTMNGGYAYTYQGVALGQNGGSTGNLSLNGGTLEAGAIWKGGGTGNLSFNGGTLKATRNEWNFISGLNSANIYGNGAGIDNGGKGIGINQTLTGSGGLYLYGGGTTYLRQGNQYTGGTFINAGTLDLRGDQSYSSQYTIGNGARLNVTSDSTWFYNAPGFNFTSSGNGNITADSGNFIMSANTSYTTAGGALNLIDGSKGINLNGYKATFDVARGSDATADLRVSTALWNSGSMDKTGNGILELSAANTYTGATTVKGGTLAVNGSIAGALQVDAGATLKGSGTMAGAATISGTHSPGNSPGLQSFGSDLTYKASSTALLEFTQNSISGRGVSFDGINVGGDLAIESGAAVNLLFNGAESSILWSDAFWKSNQSWLLYQVGGTTTGNFSLANANWQDSSGNYFNADLTGSAFSITQNGENVMLTYAIPEPSTYALLGLGAVALVIAARRRAA
jgi:autotransporter-associated beta strand protein